MPLRGKDTWPVAQTKPLPGCLEPGRFAEKNTTGMTARYKGEIPLEQMRAAFSSRELENIGNGRSVRAVGSLCIIGTLEKRAGVVQWQYRSFPSFGRGFDSHRPLQAHVNRGFFRYPLSALSGHSASRGAKPWNRRCSRYRLGLRPRGAVQRRQVEHPKQACKPWVAYPCGFLGYGF